MSLLVFINNTNGSLSKNAMEVLTYGIKIAVGESVSAVTFGSWNEGELEKAGNYGATQAFSHSISKPDDSQLSKLIVAAIEKSDAKTIIICQDLVGRLVAPRVSARLKAGLVSGTVGLPDGGNYPKNVFSGKAKANTKVKTEQKIIALTPNSIPVELNETSCVIENFDADLGLQRVISTEVKKREGDISLGDADIVVSAGRGLKGPENWGMIEELAKLLRAATACSRPVADIGWRPHHEHVGQTGLAIRPNLYVAIGISGAIQHLAGVNQSKIIVVINTDPEAPFFKAADYGVVGDAFEVVPKLNAAIQSFKG